MSAKRLMLIGLICVSAGGVASVLYFDAPTDAIQADQTGQADGGIEDIESVPRHRPNPQRVESDHDPSLKTGEPRKASDSGRVGVVTVDHDLAPSDSQLKQNASEQAASTDQPLSRVTAEYEAKLRAERARADALATSLAGAKRDEAAHIDVLRQQIDGEHTRAASLGRDLAAAREQLKQAALEKVASNRENRPSATALTDLEAKLQSERQRSAVLAVKLATSERVAMVLPQGVPARVILSYLIGSEVGRTRATAWMSELRAQGLDVSDPVGTPESTSTSSVSYFYAEDEATADSVAHALALSKAARRRLNVDHQLPRPGTVEIAVAG